jgi:hypothetical protein
MRHLAPADVPEPFAGGTTPFAGEHRSGRASYHAHLMSLLPEYRQYERTATALVICCLVALCAWQIWAYRRVEIYHPDSSTYVVLAQNIANGGSYSFDNRPHTRFPPGLPVLLAAWSSRPAESYGSAIRVMPIFGLVALVASFFLIKRVESWPIAMLACLWLATSPEYFRLATRYIWSDLPYFAFAALALLLAEHLLHKDGRWRVASAVGLAVAMVAAVLTRSAGIALIAAFGATIAHTWRATDRRGRAGLLAAVAMAVLVQAWWSNWTRSRAVIEYAGAYMHSYATQFLLKDPLEPELGVAGIADLAGRVGYFASAQLTRFSQLLLPVPWVDVLWFSPLVLVPAFLLSVGLASSFRQRRSPLLAWYVLGYLGLYSLWPFDEGARFILPIFPLMFLFAWRGLRILLDRLQREPTPADRRVVLLALAAVLVVASLAYLQRDSPGRQAQAAVLFWMFALVIAAAYLKWGRVAPVSSRLWMAGGVVVAMVAMAAGLAAQVRLARENITGPATGSSRTLARAAEWLRSQPDDGAVMVQQAAIIHRLSGRHVVSFPVSSNGQFVADVMRQQRVSLLLVMPEQYEYFRPTQRARLEALLRSAPDCCRLVARDTGYEVYRVIR